MNTNNKLPCFKSAVGFFSFFSSTNVETKNVCPIAYNGLRLAEGWALKYKCSNLAQKLNLPLLHSFWQADVTGRCGLIRDKFSNS